MISTKRARIGPSVTVQTRTTGAAKCQDRSAADAAYPLMVPDLAMISGAPARGGEMKAEKGRR